MKTKLKEITINKAHELYGNPLPKEIQERMELELNWIMEHDADIVYLLAKELVKKTNEKGYLVGYRGNIGSSYIAYILGITKINPLPKQYEGFNIMFENVTDIKLCVASEHYDEICKECSNILKNEDEIIIKEQKQGIIKKNLIQTKEGKQIGNIEIQTRSLLSILEELEKVTSFSQNQIKIEDDITSIGEFLIKHELFIGVDIIKFVDVLQTAQLYTFEDLVVFLEVLYYQKDCVFSIAHFIDQALLIYKIGWYGVKYPKEYEKVGKQIIKNEV